MMKNSVHHFEAPNNRPDAHVAIPCVSGRVWTPNVTLFSHFHAAPWSYLLLIVLRTNFLCVVVLVLVRCPTHRFFRLPLVACNGGLLARWRARKDRVLSRTVYYTPHRSDESYHGYVGLRLYAYR